MWLAWALVQILVADDDDDMDVQIADQGGRALNLPKEERKVESNIRCFCCFYICRFASVVQNTSLLVLWILSLIAGANMYNLYLMIFSFTTHKMLCNSLEKC